MAEEEKVSDPRWERVLARLRATVGTQAFDLWLARLQFEFIYNNIFVCSLPTQSLTHWARNHYEEALLSAARAEYAEESLEKAVFLHRKLGQPILPPEEKKGEADEDPDPLIGSAYRVSDHTAGQDSEGEAQESKTKEDSQTHGRNPGERLSLKEVVDVLCEYFKITFEEMERSRLHEIVRKRDISIFLVRALTSATLQQIGKHFGGRSPAGVRKSLSKVEELKLESPAAVLRITQAEAYVRHRLQGAV